MSEWKLSKECLDQLKELAKDSVGDNPHYAVDEHIFYIAAMRIEELEKQNRDLKSVMIKESTSLLMARFNFDVESCQKILLGDVDKAVRRSAIKLAEKGKEYNHEIHNRNTRKRISS